MAAIAIDSAAFERILSDLWSCLENSSHIAIDSDVLDRLIKDQFEDSELNEIGREFLIGSYKDSLLEKATALEESLQLVLEQLRHFSKPELDKTAAGHLSSVSNGYRATVPAAGETVPCLSCRAVEKSIK